MAESAPLWHMAGGQGTGLERRRGRWRCSVERGRVGDSTLGHRAAGQTERTAYTLLRPATHLVRPIVITSYRYLAEQHDRATKQRLSGGASAGADGGRLTDRGPMARRAAAIKNVRRHARDWLLLFHIPESMLGLSRSPGPDPLGLAGGDMGAGRRFLHGKVAWEV